MPGYVPEYVSEVTYSNFCSLDVCHCYRQNGTVCQERRGAGRETESRAVSLANSGRWQTSFI